MWKSVGLVLKALVESRLAKQIAGVVVVALLEESRLAGAQR